MKFKKHSRSEVPRSGFKSYRFRGSRFTVQRLKNFSRSRRKALLLEGVVDPQATEKMTNRIEKFFLINS
jgi:hypothetical protein